MAWRRLVTIPGYALAGCLWLAAAPVWLPLAALVDAARRSRGVAVRSGAFVGVYLGCEILGIGASAALWAVKFAFERERWLDLHFRLEAWWGATLFGAVVRIFGMRVEVEGEVAAELGRGPFLLLLRHASSGDTLLASALICRPHGLRLRYVLKRELLWDPCLDIVGSRLPNVFVDRASDDSAAEIRRVQELARDLGPRDGVLIYPEGTRWSPGKLARARDRLRQAGDTRLFEYASSLSFVLPPRPGGTLGLLEAAPEADVIVCSHTGFEGAASLASIWRGALVHRLVQVHFRRILRREIPAARDARRAWLLEEWRRVDSWVGSHQA